MQDKDNESFSDKVYSFQKSNVKTSLEPPGSSLALTGNNAVQPLERFSESVKYVQQQRKKIFKLRRDIGEHYKRVKPCGLHVQDKNQPVSVARGSTNKAVFYSGLQSCKSVWACPVCSMKIAHQRAEEVKEMLSVAVLEQKNRGLFLTLTLPHTRFEDCKTLQSSVTNAWRNLTADVRYKGQYRTKNKVTSLVTMGLKQQFNVKGFIRALEVKKGAKGWHPHLHVVFVLGDSAGVALQAFTEEIIAIWSSIITRMTGKTINRAGQEGTEIYDLAGIADYTTKWDVGKELTEQHKKSGQGLTPFELFYKYQETQETSYLNDFLHYCKAFEGVKQLTFSSGFKKQFNNNQEVKTEEQICSDEKTEQVLLSISYDLFSYLVKNRVEAHFLNLVQFSPHRVEAYLQSFFSDSVYNAADHGPPLYKLE